MSRIIVFDADGTLYEGFSIFPLYEAFADEGFIPRSSNDILQDVLHQYSDKYIDYNEFVVNTLIVASDVLKGRQLAVANRISELFFSDPEFSWFGFVKPLIIETNSLDVETALLTAEPQFIASSISNTLGFDECHSSQFTTDDGTFTGNVSSSLGSSRKGTVTRQLIIDKTKSWAFGDSEGDIGMLELVDTAVCVSPTDTLRSRAVSESWIIVEDPNNIGFSMQFTKV